MDGEVVGWERFRPVAPGVASLEALWVGPEHRGRGAGREMLRRALIEAGTQGFREMRLLAAGEAMRRLAAGAGFERRCECAVWTASRLEGPDLPRLAAAAEVAALAAWLENDPAWRAYGGINPSPDALLDLGSPLLAALAGEGRVRLGAGGRSVALLRQSESRRRLPVTFVAGDGGLSGLLLGLRFEADALGLDSVALLAPPDHPQVGALEETGYHRGLDEDLRSVHVRAL